MQITLSDFDNTQSTYALHSTIHQFVSMELIKRKLASTWTF